MIAMIGTRGKNADERILALPLTFYRLVMAWHDRDTNGFVNKFPDHFCQDVSKHTDDNDPETVHQQPRKYLFIPGRKKFVHRSLF